MLPSLTLTGFLSSLFKWRRATRYCHSKAGQLQWIRTRSSSARGPQFAPRLRLVTLAALGDSTSSHASSTPMGHAESSLAGPLSAEFSSLVTFVASVLQVKRGDWLDSCNGGCWLIFSDPEKWAAARLPG